MLPEIIAAGLLDEFYLVIHPVIAGQERQLLAAGGLQELLLLKLAEIKIFQKGCVAHHYVRQ